LVFLDLNKDPNFGGQDFTTNLIMPEPTVPELRFPACSIVRPTTTEGAAMGAAKFLTAMGLQFFKLIQDLAKDADETRREDH
jgi:hypothetical protein